MKGWGHGKTFNSAGLSWKNPLIDLSIKEHNDKWVSNFPLHLWPTMHISTFTCKHWAYSAHTYAHKYVIYNVSLTSSNNDPGLRSVNLIVVFVLACKTNTIDFLFHSRMLLHVLAADWITQSALSMFWVEIMEINQLTFVLTFRLRELCGKRLLWRIKYIYDAISNFKVISSAFQKWIENLNSTWINDGIWSFVIQKNKKKNNGCFILLR